MLLGIQGCWLEPQAYRRGAPMRADLLTSQKNRWRALKRGFFVRRGRAVSSLPTRMIRRDWVLTRRRWRVRRRGLRVGAPAAQGPRRPVCRVQPVSSTANGTKRSYGPLRDRAEIDVVGRQRHKDEGRIRRGVLKQQFGLVRHPLRFHRDGRHDHYSCPSFGETVRRGPSPGVVPSCVQRLLEATAGSDGPKDRGLLPPQAPAGREAGRADGR